MHNVNDGSSQKQCRKYAACMCQEKKVPISFLLPQQEKQSLKKDVTHKSWKNKTTTVLRECGQETVNSSQLGQICATHRFLLMCLQLSDMVGMSFTNVVSFYRCSGSSCLQCAEMSHCTVSVIVFTSAHCTFKALSKFNMTLLYFWGIFIMILLL